MGPQIVWRKRGKGNGGFLTWSGALPLGSATKSCKFICGHFTTYCVIMFRMGLAATFRRLLCAVTLAGGMGPLWSTNSSVVTVATLPAMPHTVG